MDAEQLTVLGKGEKILERAHEVARQVEERTDPAYPGVKIL